MTRPRMIGEDTPFGRWVRQQKELDSLSCSLSLTDVDMIFQKYRSYVDGIGDRTVKLMMQVEVKTFDGKPNRSQTSNLFLTHQLLRQKRKLYDTFNGKVQELKDIWHFGYFVLSLEKDEPSDDTKMWWGIFNDRGELEYRRCTTTNSLRRLLSFELRPDNPDPHSPLSIRRHHKISNRIIQERTDLGFYVERMLTFRS